MKISSTEKKLITTIFLIYVFFISQYGGSYMSDSILAQAMSLVEQRTAIIDDYVKEGCIKSGCDHSFYKGHFYSGFEPGTSFSMLPAYMLIYPLTKFIPEGFLNRPGFQIKQILLNFFSVLLVIIPFSILSSVLLYRISTKITNKRNVGILLALALSFGTLFFYYSTGFWKRIISGSLLSLAFYLVFNYHEPKKRTSLFLAGLLAGWAVVIELPLAIIAVIFAIYTLVKVKNKNYLYFILGAALPAIFLFAYNYLIFGSLLKANYSYRISSDAARFAQTGAFMGFRFDSLSGVLERIWWYTFSPRYGYFLYMPIFILLPLGLYYGFKEKKYNPEIIFSIAALLVFLIQYGLFNAETPTTFGPRYFKAIITITMFPLIFAAWKMRKTFIAFLIPSIILNALPTMYIIENTDLYGLVGLPLIKNLFMQIYEQGFTNYTLNVYSQEISHLSLLFKNVVAGTGILIIIIILYFVWKGPQKASSKTI